MRRLILALAAGLVFGLGLTVSSMINPAKVLAFLDVAGDWDASLALVMAAAVPMAWSGFALARRRATPLAASVFQPPTARAIDRRLVVGAILFGAGWGLVGYCPGPALAALGVAVADPEGTDLTGAPLFVLAMLVGMAVVALIDRRVSLRFPSTGSSGARRG
ncbi:DUF6691 family protein [Nitrospirillum sp. BR 11163]|uniref:DUF6691 family protein n=1 Tax=Nitrospirillum sp. BR 11163 TaxID=3104323 RepID=UPI002AFDCF9A|nr:DUF6691 family protein [Nitrospirillum sp. BR 11163]MEA1674037.1 DUF6691 family protein [Nitrospirillum sp. BR 11163]